MKRRAAEEPITHADDDGEYIEPEEDLQRRQKLPRIASAAVKFERSSSECGSDSESDSVHASDNSMRSMKQSVVEWIRLCYTTGTNGWTPKSDIFDDYLSEWARMGKEPLLTAPAFGRLVHKAFPGIKSCRMGPRVRARHCYKGLVRRMDEQSGRSSSPCSSSPAVSSPIMSSASYSPHPAEASQQVVIDLESALMESELLTMGTVKKEHLSPLPTEDEEQDLFAGPTATTAPCTGPCCYNPNGQAMIRFPHTVFDTAGSTSSSTSSPVMSEMWASSQPHSYYQHNYPTTQTLPHTAQFAQRNYYPTTATTISPPSSSTPSTLAQPAPSFPAWPLSNFQSQPYYSMPSYGEQDIMFPQQSMIRPEWSTTSSMTPTRSSGSFSLATSARTEALMQAFLGSWNE